MLVYKGASRVLALLGVTACLAIPALPQGALNQHNTAQRLFPTQQRVPPGGQPPRGGCPPGVSCYNGPSDTILRFWPQAACPSSPTIVPQASTHDCNPLANVIDPVSTWVSWPGAPPAFRNQLVCIAEVTVGHLLASRVNGFSLTCVQLDGLLCACGNGVAEIFVARLIPGAPNLLMQPQPGQFWGALEIVTPAQCWTSYQGNPNAVAMVILIRCNTIGIPATAGPQAPQAAGNEFVLYADGSTLSLSEDGSRTLYFAQRFRREQSGGPRKVFLVPYRSRRGASGYLLREPLGSILPFGLFNQVGAGEFQIRLPRDLPPGLAGESISFQAVVVEGERRVGATDPVSLELTP